MLNLNGLYPLPVGKDFPRAFHRMDPHPTGDIWAQAFFFFPQRAPRCRSELAWYPQLLLRYLSVCVLHHKERESRLRKTLLRTPSPSLNPAVPAVPLSQHGLPPKAKAGTTTSPYSEASKLSLPRIPPPLSHLSQEFSCLALELSIDLTP